MSNGRGSRLTSGFDDLLARNRQQFDGLFGGRRSSSPARPTAPAVRDEPARTPDLAPSPTAQALDARFGDGWHCDIVERRRDRDDYLVTCRLTVPGHGPVMTGRGRAGRGGARIAGRVGDIPFSAGTGTRQSDSDAAAWQAATEQALAACLAQIGS